MTRIVSGKRKRVKTYAALKRELDSTFSVWTRRRFADSNGMVRCITCQKVSHWKTVDAGHYVSRSYLATRWHPENVHPQCKGDNGFRNGAMPQYTVFGIDRYGPDWPQRMVSLSRETRKYSRADLQTLIDDYKAKIEGLGE